MHETSHTINRLLQILRVLCECMHDGDAYGYPSLIFFFLLLAKGDHFKLVTSKWSSLNAGLTHFKWQSPINTKQRQNHQLPIGCQAIWSWQALGDAHDSKHIFEYWKQDSCLHLHITNLYIQISPTSISRWFNHITLQHWMNAHQV